MMRLRLGNLTLCVAALLFACPPLAGARDVGAGQTVEVRAGREVTLAAHKLKIRFIAVREDSRCPEGVQCIWAGNASVALKLSRTRGSAAAATVVLNTLTEPREITYANYTIKLTSLAPRPVKDGRPRARDYVATLVVSKKS